MYGILENAQMDTDLNANNHKILNLADISPLPATLCSSTDPRLSDARNPLPGSVTNASVNANAGIQQSKLSLNGIMPPLWLGNTTITAARGDLAEFKSNKGVANGYASLDGTGKVPVAQLPSGLGTGTVTSVALSLPAQFTLTGSPITGAGTFGVGWASIAPGSWFGNPTFSSAPPTFQNSPLPISIIPNMDASKITSGIMGAELLPLAVGVGPSHAQGIVPDPGPAGNPADYLARDMTFKNMPVVPVTYEPTMPDPTYGSSSNNTGPISITPHSALGMFPLNWFGSFTSANGPFTELNQSTQPYWSVPPLGTIWFYSARAGYQDSKIVSATNTNPS